MLDEYRKFQSSEFIVVVAGPDNGCGIAACCARSQRPRSRAAEQRDELATFH
jgi:hypothetical protein